MNTDKNIKKIICRTIENEMGAVKELLNFVDADFVKTVEKILEGKGRVIVTGIGKSANIGTKIVSTLNSTGTPAIFMHAADAIHGDLGIIQKNDIVICISKSGQTPEIKVLVPFIKSFGNTLVAMVGNMDSFLALEADLRINCSVSKEACPNNLAPTASTTAQLVMGDALAVALLECRGFTQKDFARYHPGGALGKQLYLRVHDLSILNGKPCVQKNDSAKDVIIEISSKRLGMTAVLDGESLVGIITDGDVRRMLLNGLSIERTLASDIMSKNPKHIREDALAVEALELMRNNNITQTIVVNEEGCYCGVLHLHDLLREGII